MREFLDAARELAAQGHPVVVLYPRSKRPVHAAWQERATTDIDVLEIEWHARPDANVGVLGGDGLAMVDVDTDKGGMDTLARLEFERGEWLPDTRTVRTGSNGRHYWFTTAGDVASWNPGAGLEVRAAGRQCVAPPSVHPNGSRYVWLEADAELAPLPEWLIKPAPRTVTVPHVGLVDPVLEIAPEIYVPALTGREPNSSGFIVCPLHADTDPSLKVYAGAERGWFCFGCERGGGIVQLAAALAGIDSPVRGRDFLGIVDYLRGRFA
jgi:hypothetical protein